MVRCVRCGLCLSVCPTYQQTLDEAESPRGRITMARAFIEGRLNLTPDLWRHLQSCLICEACTAICPTDVHMESIAVSFRVVVNPCAPGSLLSKAALGIGLDRVLADQKILRFSARLLRLYQRSGAQSLARRSGLLRLLGLDQADHLLPLLDDSFMVASGQQWMSAHVPVRPVALFTGCVMNVAFSRVNEATARVLAANGCQVRAPVGQGCCGALHLHIGSSQHAREMARRNVDAFEAMPDDAIVCNAAGCTAALKKYGELLADDPGYAGRAREFAARVRDVTEFLVDIPLIQPLGEINVRATYQAPCHLAHAQGIHDAPRKLLNSIPGLTLVEMDDPDFCCGSAGIYSLTNSKMSQELLGRKLRNVLATGAQVVVSANPGCMLQLDAGLRADKATVAVRHIVELLDEAYRQTEELSL